MKLRLAIPSMVLALAVASVALVPAFAQQEDDQTDDHAERDRRYLERYQKPKAPAPPPEEPAEDPREQARYFAYVDDLIRDRNYRVHTGDFYRVQTDDPRIDPKAVAALLDGFREFFDEHLGDRLDLEDYDERSRVYLFWSYHKYNQLLGADFSRQTLRPAGHYGSGFDAVTLHTDSATPGDIPDLAIHEATHQLVDQRISWVRNQVPTWLAEGLACYFGYMQVDADGTFHPNRVGSKQVALLRDEKPGKATGSATRLAVFKKSARQPQGDSIYGQLLWMTEPAQFYGEDTVFHYAAAWLLVHWLLQGDDGVHAEAFLDWVALEAAGKAEPQGLVDALGLSLEEIDEAVIQHAKGLKAR